MRRLLSLYDHASRGQFIFLDLVNDMWLRIVGGVVIVAVLAVIVGLAVRTNSRATESADMSRFPETIRAAARASNARIYPVNDATGAPNCVNGWCREIDFYDQRATGAAEWYGYDSIPGVGTRMVTFTGVNPNGTRKNLALGEPVPIIAAFHREPMSQEGHDPMDPYAPIMNKWWTASGAWPADRVVRMGIPFPQAFGLTGIQEDNALVVVRVTSLHPGAGDGFVFATGPLTLAPMNLTADVGFYTPPPAAPIVPVGLTGNTLLMYYPTAPYPSFGLTESNYHDAFFAEQGTCGGVLAPYPDYVATGAGASPIYYPAHMWGQPGPWLYPNPNPTTPPASYVTNPATFSSSGPAGAGYCAFAAYDAYHDRTQAPPLTIPVQVMGQFSASPTSLTWSSPSDGNTRVVTLAKTFDTQPLQSSIVASTCGAIVNASIAAGATPGTPSASPATDMLSLTPVQKNGANVGGTCTLTLASQYAGEPRATVAINVPAPVGTMGLLDGGVNPGTGTFATLWQEFQSYVMLNGWTANNYPNVAGPTFTAGCSSGTSPNGAGYNIGGGCIYGPYVNTGATQRMASDGTTCPSGDTCMRLVVISTTFCQWGCTIDPPPGCTGGGLPRPPGCNPISKKVGFFSYADLGPYLQQGVAFTPGQPGSRPQGTYHYPLRTGGLSGDMTPTWCMTNGGPSVALLTANAAAWGVPTPAAGYNPSMCYDTSLFDIPGVQYPNMLYNGAGQAKTNLATGTMPTPVPTATPVPTPAPLPTPTPRTICTPAMHRLGIC